MSARHFGPDGPCVACNDWHAPHEHTRPASERAANRRYVRKRNIPAAEWRRNGIAFLLHVRRIEHREACIAAEIRRLLPATEGQVTFALRCYPGDDVSRVLRAMVGSRCGRETTGEVVVASYVVGGELYALRTEAEAIAERAMLARWHDLERRAAAVGSAAAP